MIVFLDDFCLFEFLAVIIQMAVTDFYRWPMALDLSLLRVLAEANLTLF